MVVSLHFAEYADGVIPGAQWGVERSRPLRADAERNRERIVSAAARLFAEQGLSVPLEDVARAAGVGVATLYRRFPTRTDLAIACTTSARCKPPTPDCGHCSPPRSRPAP